MNPLNYLTGGSALLNLIVLVIIAALALSWRPTRRAIFFALSLAPSALLWITGVVAIVFWWPVSWATDRLLRFIPLDRLISKVILLPAHSSRSPLLRGDRLGFAKSVWPQAIYPDLYQEVPDDIRRPVFEDGRLLGGVGLSWLADRHLTDLAFRSAISTGFKAGVLLFILSALMPVLGALKGILFFIPSLFNGERPVLEQWPGDEPIRTSAWSLFTANLGEQASIIGHQFAALLIYLPASGLMSIGAAILIAMLLLRTWMRDQASPYELVTKDADVRWPQRIESRNILRHTYRKQIEQAVGRLKGQPIFKVGNATGTLRARGDLAAPTAGQAVCLDYESLFQHTLVLGGTGEGKTTAILKPLIRQILANRSFGAFVVDAKGVLWRDVQGIAKSLGRADDVIIVGNGPGAHGLNFMANLDPSQVTAALRSVLTQVGSKSSDSFWPDMASTVMRHTLTLGRAYAYTPAGKAEVAAGLHPYSIWWAYQALLRPDLLDSAIAAIREHGDDIYNRVVASRDQGEIDALTAEVSTLMSPPQVVDSISYIEVAWRNFEEKTKSSIVATLTSLLDGLGAATELRERFASGATRAAAPIEAALNGKLVLVSLSSVEDGLPARLISILIKTALYREARVREAAWKGTRNPQDHPCLVIMDEVQELATVDPSSGLSDATFWNVARSTGIAGIFATQNLAALEQAMGGGAAKNFIQQARSKIFLRTEEQETVAYASWCAGEYERNLVFEDGQRESIDYRTLIDGWEPLSPVDPNQTIPGGPRAFFEAARVLLNPDRARLQRAAPRPTYGADLRFIASDPTPAPNSGSPGNSASMGSLSQAFWRSEDLTRSYRSQGNDRRSALTASDILHMGRWHAFAHIQRAGAVRQDIITVDHDFQD